MTRKEKGGEEEEDEGERRREMVETGEGGKEEEKTTRASMMEEDWEGWMTMVVFPPYGWRGVGKNQSAQVLLQVPYVWRYVHYHREVLYLYVLGGRKEINSVEACRVSY